MPFLQTLPLTQLLAWRRAMVTRVITDMASSTYTAMIFHTGTAVALLADATPALAQPLLGAADTIFDTYVKFAWYISSF